MLCFGLPIGPLHLCEAAIEVCLPIMAICWADPAAAGPGSECATTLPSHFASVTHCNSRLQRMPPPPPLPAGEAGFVPALVPGTRTVLPGYPTLKNLSVIPSLKPVAVEVLGQPSKKDSLVLQVKVHCPTMAITGRPVQSPL